MNDLIEALQILNKYADQKDRWPTHCEHDCLYVHAGIDPDEVSEKDIKRLEELGFEEDDDGTCFISFRFGSC